MSEASSTVKRTETAAMWKNRGAAGKPKSATRTYQLVPGKKMLDFSHKPEVQARMQKALWDYNFGDKRPIINKQKVGEVRDEVPSFHLGNSNLLDEPVSLESSAFDNTIHNKEWIKKEQDLRRRKNYRGPIPYEQFLAEQNADTSKAKTDDKSWAGNGASTGKQKLPIPDSDSTFSESILERERARRRRKNYRGPLDILEEENMKKDGKAAEGALESAVRKQLVQRRTLADYANYSDILKENAAYNDSSKRQNEDSRKEPSVFKETKSSSEDGTATKAKIDVSAIRGEPGGTVRRFLSVNDDISDLSIGSAAGSRALYGMKTSTPLSVRKPDQNRRLEAETPRFQESLLIETEEDHGQDAEQVPAVVENEMVKLDEVEATEENRDQSDKGSEEDATLLDEANTPIEGTVPSAEESALPEDANSAQTETSSLFEEAIDKQTKPTARVDCNTFPRRSKRQPKPKPVCRMCDDNDRCHY